MTLEDRGNYDYAMQATEEIATREAPDFEEKTTISEKEELEQLLAQRQESLKVEREEAALGISGAEERAQRLEKMITSLEKKIKETTNKN